jgi:hypothetical protein
VESDLQPCHIGGMDKAPYTGFRFSHSRPDVSAPSGKLTVHILVVARDQDEAKELAGNLLPLEGLRFLSSGDDDLKAARLVHLRDGAAKIL